MKSKTFEEIQALYKKVKRFDESFTAVGYTEDERRIKEMNEGVKDSDQKSLKKRVVEETPKKDDTTEIPAKQDVAKQGTKKRKGGHIKMIVRKKPRQKSDVDNEDEHRKCLKIVTFEGTIDSEIMKRKLFSVRLQPSIRNYLDGIGVNSSGSLKIMMESSQEENDQSDFWDDQQDWEIVFGDCIKACGVLHTSNLRWDMEVERERIVALDLN
ncbi:hypothetical protein Tco_1218207 [Tanacetum coccineum]